MGDLQGLVGARIVGNFMDMWDLKMNILNQLNLFNFLSEHDLLDRGMTLLEQELAFDMYTEIADPEAAAKYIKRIHGHRPKRRE